MPIVDKISKHIIILFFTFFLMEASAQEAKVQLEKNFFNYKLVKKVNFKNSYKIILGAKKALKILFFDATSNKLVDEKEIYDRRIKIKDIRINYIDTYESRDNIFLFYEYKVPLPSDGVYIKALIINKKDYSLTTYESDLFRGEGMRVSFSFENQNGFRFYLNKDSNVYVFDLSYELESETAVTNIKESIAYVRQFNDVFYTLSDTDYKKKLFKENDLYYLVIDDHIKNVSRINIINPDSINARTIEIPIPKLEATVSLFKSDDKIKFNSFYHKGKLYQLTFTKIEGAFSIFDMKLGKVIFEEKFKTFEDILFSNSDKVQYTNLINDIKKEKDELPMIQRLYKHSPDLVVNEEDGILKIALGAYYYYHSNYVYTPQGGYTTPVTTGKYEFGSLFDYQGNHLEGEYKLKIKDKVDEFNKKYRVKYSNSYKQKEGYILLTFYPHSPTRTMLLTYFDY